ncbi:pyridoxamine 5'-phosphate oxidase family protein [uncultured Ramlibacter sp.]|uniref:pyridoxamine 5'-phosphate oxidase family protein n=1 Tax=uncultured Ramlibacter sp. TaxID=260755 RepID=UPI00260BC7C1|nr:pyridoxamine 5'-phosphate oxidase family protein [uncultured Ramlibacter sp.]
MSKNNSPHATLWNLIKDIKFGMLTHRHANGMLHAHPLTTQNKALDDGNTLYFFISKKSELARALLADGSVNVSYAEPKTDSYVSLSGQAGIVEDQAKKDELFNTFVKAWFPGGATDPDLGLLEVHIGHAEYWDAKDSQMLQLFKMARAAVTGTPPQLEADHKELQL